MMQITTKVKESPQIVARVNALLANKDRFNDWEQGFLDSITRRIQQQYMLSTKQFNVVNKMWESFPDDLQAEYPEANF